MTKFEFEGIGTHWAIDINEELSTDRGVVLLSKIKDRVEKFDKDYSRFRDDSLVTEMSKKSGEFVLPEDADQMISLYKKMYDATEGAVTPLIGKILVDAGYDAKYSLIKKEMTPAKSWEEVMGWQSPKLTLKEPALLDFGACGKGYLVDIISEIIEKDGINSYVVDGSGDMRQRGKKELSIGLEHPDLPTETGDPQKVIGMVKIKNESLCGSAGNRRKWADMHHIVDPDTLKSPNHILSVWVIAETTILADILTTGLFFVEPEDLGKEFKFEYLILKNDYTVIKSGVLMLNCFKLKYRYLSRVKFRLWGTTEIYYYLNFNTGMKYIDNFLNKITMYRLVMWGLMFLGILAIILDLIGFLSYSKLGIVVSFFLIMNACHFSNIFLGKLFKVETNLESGYITGLILFLILLPIETWNHVWISIVVSFVAMGSKYFFVINKKHLFNPAAISIFLLGLVGSGVAQWWVGSEVMLIPVAILGFLVLRKVQRFEMFSIFAFMALITISVVSWRTGLDIIDSLKYAILSGPLIFFGTIMFTEPFTTPPKRGLRNIYAVIVGVLYGLQFQIGPVYSSPALALIIGNIFSFVVSPKDRLVLKLKEKKNLTKDTFEFSFEPSKKLNFKAGQYLEWTLGHDKPDTRGNRRYFTISSSPTEDEMKLGIKFYDKPSTFKQKLVSLNPGDKRFAAALSGEFTLPEDKNKKLVFIAGGIGVTPFRSIAKYMIDSGDKRDAILLFSNRTENDIVYKDIFDNAQNSGLKTYYVVNGPDGTINFPVEVGFIGKDMIERLIPDYKDRLFYISGPHGMVDAFELTLKKMGVSRSQIKVDFFPGYV